MRRSRSKRKMYLRAFSLFFSLFIWLYVISSAQVEVEKNIPLRLELPEGYSLTSSIPKEVVVNIKGPRVFVRKFLDKREKIKIKSKNYYRKNRKSFSVGMNSFNINLPLGVELISLAPKKVSFEIDKTLKKTVPVKLILGENILKKFDLKSTTLTPSTIEVSGAKSIIRKIKKLSTFPVEEKMLEDGQPFDIKIETNNQIVKLNHKKVEVNYSLSSKLTEFTFTQIPIIFQSTKLIKSALPKVVNVTVKGEKSFINKMNKNMIEVLASVPKNANGQIKVDLISEVPKGVEVIKVEPKTISLVTE